jgi:hypothetical protein
VTAKSSRGDVEQAALAGVFGMCPYIYGDYAAPPPPELPSMVENDGYGISVEVRAERRREAAHGLHPLVRNKVPTDSADAMMLSSSARAEMTALPKVDTNCTTQW